MKTEEIIIAGFGGQGVLSLGMTLAYAGMIEGKEVSWMPSYGPEMRGGTANCMVVLSDKKISSPILSKFDTAILLNQPSMDKFSDKVKPGGLLLYDVDNILQPATRTDIEMMPLPVTAEALKMKNLKVMNMIFLGAYLAKTELVDKKSVINALEKVLPEKYHYLVPINIKAFELGGQLANKMERQGV